MIKLKIYTGDIVRIKQNRMCDIVAVSVFDSKLNEFKYYLYNHTGTYFEKDLIIESDNKINQNNNMNLSTILKSYIGLKIYSINCGYGIVKSVKIQDINRDTTESIIVDFDGNEVGYRADGRTFPNGQVLLYPSYESYLKHINHSDNAWEEWVNKFTKKWRAEKDGQYWTIDIDDGHVYQMTDTYKEYDNNRYFCGNYFETYDDATNISGVIHQVFEKFHKNKLNAKQIM